MNKGDQTRQMIIEKAAELFNKSGYDGCSLSDIMKATNLQKGGIYNHFKNKDEIALESFDYLFQKLANLYRTSTHGATSSREKLEQIFNMFENHYSNPEIKGGCPIANTAVYSADAHPQLREKVNYAASTPPTTVKAKPPPTSSQSAITSRSACLATPRNSTISTRPKSSPVTRSRPASAPGVITASSSR